MLRQGNNEYGNKITMWETQSDLTRKNHVSNIAQA